MKLCQLASGQCFSVRPYAETGFKVSDRYNNCFLTCAICEVEHVSRQQDDRSP